MKAKGVGGHAQIEALVRRGVELHAQNRLADAERIYRDVLRRQPRHARVLHLLGLAAFQSGEAQRAVGLFDRAIAVRPDFAEAYESRGTALYTLDRLEDAVAGYDSAIRLQPDNAGAHANRANVLQLLGRHEDALAGYDRAISLRPGAPEVHFGRGATLNALGRHEEALAGHDRALALNPGYAKAVHGRAIALHGLGRLEDAVAGHNRAIALHPGFAEAFLDRGLAREALGRNEDALADHRKSAALNPDSAKAHLNLAICLLRLGRLEAGWREYEGRARLDRTLSARRYAQPLWTGQAAEGKTIFIYAEQGLGDTIQFCRYAAMLAAQGADVVLSAPQSLHGLLATLSPPITLIGPDDVPGHFDFHCPMLSLPLAFGTDLATIPAFPNYLSADGALRSAWASRLGPKHRPRIGVAWNGSRTHKNDANRSIPFGLFRSILSDDADWIALHNDLRPDEADLVHASPNLRYLGGGLKTFADTAALIDPLDLVITVDTSVAHLAGALGKPVWILLPFSADWRWLCDRRDSPWYPSARLFRQPAIGDWTAVLEAVRIGLKEFDHQAHQEGGAQTPS